MAAPDEYRKLPAGVRCRCLKLWREGDDFYCCTGAMAMAEPMREARMSCMCFNKLGHQDCLANGCLLGRNGVTVFKKPEMETNLEVRARTAELEAALAAIAELVKDGCDSDDLVEAHGRCVEVSQICAKALSR
jgi:hypothetical protein